MPTCAQCQAPKPVDKIGLCNTCRLRFYSRLKFPWTPAMDDKLRQAYKAAHSRKLLTAALDALQWEFGYPRHILTNRAVNLRLQFVQARPWTAEEVENLNEWAGSLSIKKIALRLHRSESSVRNHMFSLGISQKFESGYTQRELCRQIGVSRLQVTGWIKRGLLKLSSDVADRVTSASVRSFLICHMEEYSLRRVDEGPGQRRAAQAGTVADGTLKRRPSRGPG